MASVPHLPPPDRLDRLVTLLDAATSEDGWHQPHRLVSIESDPDTFEMSFGFRTLEPGDHPLDHLLGFVAPKAWTGIGVICFGWAAPAGDADLARGTAGTRPSHHPDRRRVRVITLLDRRGREQATASLDDGTVVDEPGSGTVSDALRRCLGLPTPPPPVGPAELFAALWLAAVANSAGDGAGWNDLVRLHPAMQLLAAEGHRPRTDELVNAGQMLHRTLTWEQIRQRAADGREDGLGIPSDLATWMDDGMFSRWVLSGLPTLPTLLRACAEVVDGGVLQRLRRTLRAWNLDPPLPRSEAQAG